MIHVNYLLSSAYFPPVNYISLIAAADSVFIESAENYIKQTWRNRCRICSANGPLTLSVPVLEGSFHKTHFKEIRIDYTKRWQQVHLGAIVSAYRSSPFFEYYYDRIKDVITQRYELLTDLNMHSLRTALDIGEIVVPVRYTDLFVKPEGNENDFRYLITPKEHRNKQLFSYRAYTQVFSDRFGFIPGLSIIDLLFNTGPDSINIIRKTVLAV